jgi:hypothetical protein
MFDSGYQIGPYAQFTACGVGIEAPEKVPLYTDIQLDFIPLEGSPRFLDESGLQIEPRTPPMSPSQVVGYGLSFWLSFAGCLAAIGVLFVVLFFASFLRNYRRKVVRQLHVHRAQNAPKDEAEGRRIRLRGMEGDEQFDYRLEPDVLSVWDTDDGFDAPGKSSLADQRPAEPAPGQAPSQPAPALAQPAPASAQSAPAPGEPAEPPEHQRRRKKHHHRGSPDGG